MRLQEVREAMNERKGFDPDHPVSCGLCGRPTPSLGTKRCDRCWELERRIEWDTELARRILDRIDSGEERP